MKQLNETVHALYEPSVGVIPNVEVVFFHGLHERKDYKQAHIETWSTFDRSAGEDICWPEKWLGKEFPKARILSVSYDSCVMRGSGEGNLDLYRTAENLVQDLTNYLAKVGQTENCPLILVGKDMGGLIVKAICVKANEERDSSRRYQSFLDNVKGVFYYCTPHQGLENMPSYFNSPLAKMLGIHNSDTSRLNEKFSKLREKQKWIAKGTGVGKETAKGWFHRSSMSVSEASSRFDVNEYYTAPGDEIHSVCKPESTVSIGYYYLAGLMKEVASSLPAKRPLPFGDEKYYVPMEKTLLDVEKAFKDSRIVVLHGGPGMGKSSLAKYIALRFHRNESLTRREGAAATPMQCSPVLAVAFVSCGHQASIISAQKNILSAFGVEYSEHQSREPEKLKEALATHLEQRCALIVLDDVWERDLVLKTLVAGDQLRYLITTQRSDLWTASDSKSVLLQDLSLKDAKRILANYAKLPGGEIPNELQSQANEIIAKVEHHPLALANIGTVIANGGEENKDPVEYWKEVKDDLLEELSEEESSAIAFGEPYPRSVHASMTLMLNVMNVPAAKKLLCVICLFKGPLVSEAVVRLFLMYYNSDDTQRNSDLKDFKKNRRNLVSRNLVQLEKEPIHKYSYQSVNQEMEEGAVFRIHGLRQISILKTMRKDIDEITRFLDPKRHNMEFFCLGERSDLDVATMLCALFGESTEASTQDRAIQRIADKYIWKARCYGKVNILNAFKILVWLTVVGDVGGGAERKPHITKAAIEVFWKFFVRGALDDENISYLLNEPLCTRWTCAFLSESTFLLPSQYQWSMQEQPVGAAVLMAKVHIPLCMERLSGLLAQDVQPILRDCAILALSHFALVADVSKDHDLRINILSTRGLFERIMHLADAPEVSEFLHAVAVGILQSVVENIDLDTVKSILGAQMVTTPHSLERIANFFVQHMDRSDESAASILAVFAEIPQGGEVIITSPLCLKRLVDLVSPDGGVEPGHQERALGSLAITARTCNNDTVTKILSHNDLLGRVVQLLSKERGNRCLLAVDIIGALAGACGDRISEAPQFPAIVQRLAMLVDKDCSVDVRRSAVQTLADIMSSVKEQAYIEMLATPRFVEGAVMLVNDVRDGREEQARIGVAKLIDVLTKAQKGLEELGDCARRCVNLMASGQPSSIQSDATGALAKITACENEQLRMTTLACPRLFERIIMYLSSGVQENTCIGAVQITRHLIRRGCLSQEVLGSMAACGDGLVNLLTNDLQATVQEEAIWALGNVAESGGMKLWANNLFEAVLKYVSKDVAQVMCRGATKIIPLLPRGQEKIRRSLERLALLLGDDVDGSVQTAALSALAELSRERHASIQTAVRIALRMLQCPGLLERVGTYLSEDMEEDMRRQATQIIKEVKEDFNWGFYRGREELEAIAGCLESDRFTQLLSPGVHASVQKVAVSALTHLVDRKYRLLDDIQILATRGLLERLVSLSSRDGRYRAVSIRILRLLVKWPANNVLISLSSDPGLRLLVEESEEADDPEEVAESDEPDEDTIIGETEDDEDESSIDRFGSRDAQKVWKRFEFDDEVAFDLFMKSHQNLLVLMALCDGPCIPEEIIQFLWEESKDPAIHVYQNFTDAMAELQIRQFVEDASHAGLNREMKSWSLNETIEGFVLRSFVWNDEEIPLIQRLSNMNIMFKLDSKFESQVVLTLAALYFNESFRNDFAQQSSLETEGNMYTLDQRKVIIEPIARLLMLHKDDTWSPVLYSSARQVFLSYVRDGQFHEESTMNFLHSCDHALPMINTLVAEFAPGDSDESDDSDQFYDSDDSDEDSDDDFCDDSNNDPDSHDDNVRRRFDRRKENSFVPPNVMSSLVGLLEKSSTLDTSGKQEVDLRLFSEVSYAIGRLARKGRNTSTGSANLLEGGTLTRAFTHIANILITANLNHESRTQSQIVTAIADFGSCNIIQSELANVPKLPEGLITAFFEHGNQNLQAQAARGLGNLSSDIDSFRLRLVNASGMLNELVKALTMQHDDELQCQAASLFKKLSMNEDAALKILTYPGALEGLLSGLRNSGASRARNDCAAVFVNLGALGNNITLKLTNGPRLLEGLVMVFLKNGKQAYQSKALSILSDLVANNDSLRFEVEEWVRAFFRDSDPDIPAAALIKVCRLGKEDSLRLKLIDVPGMLEGLIKALTPTDHFDSELQNMAAELFLILSGSEHAALKIVDSADAIAGLLNCLGTDTEKICDVFCAATFVYLASHSDAMRVRLIQFPEVIPGLVDALSRKGRINSLTRAKAGRALASLAKGGDHVKLKMRNLPCLDLLEKLVTAARKDDNDGRAIYALTHLSPSIGKDMQLHSAVAYSRRGEAERDLGFYQEALEDLDKACSLDNRSNLYDSTDSSTSLELSVGLYSRNGSIDEEDLDESLGSRDVEDDDDQDNQYEDQAETRRLRSLLEEDLFNNDNPCAEDEEDQDEARHLEDSFNDEARRLRSLLEEDLFDNARQPWPPNDKTFSTRCYVKTKLSDFQGALADANSALQMKSSTFTYQERGVLKCMMDDLTGALADLNQSFKLSRFQTYGYPTTSRYKYALFKHRGFVKFRQGDEKGARADAELAMECKPRVVDDPTYGNFCLGESSVEYLGFQLR